MSDLDQRLETALKKRSQVDSNVQRIKGRLEAAQKALSEVEAECREKNVDPEKLSDVIAKLQARYEQEVVSLETQVQQAEQALTPYLGDSL